MLGEVAITHELQQLAVNPQSAIDGRHARGWKPGGESYQFCKVDTGLLRRCRDAQHEVSSLTLIVALPSLPAPRPDRPPYPWSARRG